MGKCGARKVIKIAVATCCALFFLLLMLVLFLLQGEDFLSSTMAYSDSHCLASPLFENIENENAFQEKGFAEAVGLGGGFGRGTWSQRSEIPALPPLFKHSLGHSRQ